MKRQLLPSACLALFLVLTLSLSSGCVRRTIRISTEPSQALVYLNDQEIGRSEVSTEFVWYGDYDVVVRKEGYETLKTNWKITPPWYQWMPLDFFFEVLWPGEIHDVRTNHFVLTETTSPDAEELIQRAEGTREQALNPPL